MTGPGGGAAPVPSFAHLIELSDDVGLLEHARGPVPRRASGYCLDDNARALLVVAGETDPSPEVARLGPRYLAFVLHAQDDSGLFRNRLDYARRWEDDPSAGDWWGRAVWALGVVAATDGRADVRRVALDAFRAAAAHRPPYLRAMAFAGLGAAALVEAGGDGGPEAVALLADAAARAEAGGSGESGASGASGWAWPEPRLAYANAAVAEVVLAAGVVLDDEGRRRRGLDLLYWLVQMETRHGHLSPAPVGGRGPHDPRPGFDQQPIEAGVLAGACARAWQLTGDSYWSDAVRSCVGWFMGDNDAGVALYDPATGGCCDGLQPAGRNENQGAESTLAALSTLQQARRIGAVRP